MARFPEFVRRVEQPEAAPVRERPPLAEVPRPADEAVRFVERTENTASNPATDLGSRVLWALINTLQFSFLALWSALWITAAILIMCVTFDRERSISYARRAWAPGLLFMSGARMDVQGFDKLDPDQPYVFVFNHESLIDTPVVFYSVPYNVRFVAKKEVALIPFIGWYCWAMGFIFVDRKNHERAMASMKKAGQRVREGANVTLFPEGTRSRDGYVHGFKKGAFRLALEAGVPIVPCTIRGSRDVLACDGFRVRPGTIHVRCGEPIPTAGRSVEDRDAILSEARQQIVDTHVALGGLGGHPDDPMVLEGRATGRAA